MKNQATQGKTVHFAVVLALALIMSGCASTKYGAVNVSSNPPGAEVINLKDESNMGSTPAKITFPGKPDTSEFVTIQLRKPGYIDRITTFWVNRRYSSPADADMNAVDIQVDLEKRVAP